MNSRPTRSGGFTILELMITVALAGILLAIGVPSFNNFVRASRITSPTNELLTSMYLARNEAIKRRVPVVFCFSTTPTAAVPNCAGTGAQGWVVWVDVANPAVPSANDRNGRPDANEPILARHTAVLNGVTVRTTPAVNGRYVSYAPSGLARTVPVAGVAVTGVLVCDVRGNVAVGGGTDSAARGMQLTGVGRARVLRSVAEITASFGACP